MWPSQQSLVLLYLPGYAVGLIVYALNNALALPIWATTLLAFSSLAYLQFTATKLREAHQPTWPILPALYLYFDYVFHKIVYWVVLGLLMLSWSVTGGYKP
jgi:hypothetical protein